MVEIDVLDLGCHIIGYGLVGYAIDIEVAAHAKGLGAVGLRTRIERQCGRAVVVGNLGGEHHLDAPLSTLHGATPREETLALLVGHEGIVIVAAYGGKRCLGVVERQAHISVKGIRACTVGIDHRARETHSRECLYHYRVCVLVIYRRHLDTVHRVEGDGVSGHRETHGRVAQHHIAHLVVLVERTVLGQPEHFGHRAHASV